MIGNCPKCNNMVSRINLNEVNSSSFVGTSWRTITLNCPSCNAILGAQIDPIAIKTDTVNEIKRVLGK